MSTATRRTYDQAFEDAEAFRALFPPACYERWEFAGSLRRHARSIGDIEHVIVPRFELISAGLFTTEPRNLLWLHLDALEAGRSVSKHWYGSAFRWGSKYRGVDFRGFNHELFTATADNFGPTLAIRTGPADFSKRLVTGLLRRGHRQHEGQVWNCITCDYCDGSGGYLPDAPNVGRQKCSKCDGTGLLPVEPPIRCPTEEEYFELCGADYVEPFNRF